MAGLLAWAADVVGGGGGQNNEEEGSNSIPITLTPEQQRYVHELDQKAVSLRRSIQDLRLRLPPPDISQRLPHLHAHSLASNAALALQLNSHSATREQAQLREVTLHEENAAFEKAISNCEIKIQEKKQEADSLKRKLEEMEESEKNLRAELENGQTAIEVSSITRMNESAVEFKAAVKTEEDSEASKSAILDKLDEKKKELSSTEEMVNNLEKKWSEIQDKALKQPTPAQREKILDKQLHSLIEQLEAKQAQAEGLVGEIHSKEIELEGLNGLWRRLESTNLDGNPTRYRFGRNASLKEFASSDSSLDSQQKMLYTGGRNENQKRLMLLRSSFVLYILALHILVFIKISF